MAARPANSAAILTIALELGAAGMLTLIAGSSDEMGTAVLIFVVGLWLIYAVTDSGILNNVVGAFRSLVTYPKNNPVYAGIPGDMYENYGGAGNNQFLPGNVPTNAYSS